MYKVSFYLSKYGAKQQVLVGHKLLYQGTLVDCPKELLDQTYINTTFKFVNVWKKE